MINLLYLLARNLVYVSLYHDKESQNSLPTIESKFSSGKIVNITFDMVTQQRNIFIQGTKMPVRITLYNRISRHDTEI